MKFKGFLFATLLFVSSLLHAQTDGSGSNASMKMGLHGGLNLSKFQTELDSTDASARIGWQGGLMLRYGGNLFIEGNLNLGQSSANMMTTDSLGTVETTVYRTFMALPVMAGLKIFSSEDGSSSVRLMGGIEFMSILKTAVNDSLLNIEADDFKPYSLAAVGGIGMDLWFLRFDLALRYGLTPMLSTDPDSKIVMGTFNIGVIF
ncbi:MAG: hypothetical protein A2W93_10500 [Bacteroidetes bacterium GWF2_43_63]|nr:MAG: hypothetical protein A2W94_01970 [Bacteroidetes bacterium GWE2_42_42]OFY52948.1 MAG: hypothetical protein A2W93_10500 [Bacteroidetes bacterium GWF2_43_63]HBG70158.1 hypothetical protein [Bacteroidales bacterium]HCB62235.1 hypothetical protein [Bacteroidales bacterium]